MTAQKCKNIWLQAALNDFWSSNPKTKRIKFVKTLTSSREFAFKWFKILLQSENFQVKFNFEGLQNYKRNQNFLRCSYQVSKITFTLYWVHICRRACENNSSLNFMSLVGFHLDVFFFFWILQSKFWNHVHGEIIPWIPMFLDNLPYGVEESRELWILIGWVLG